MKRNRFRRFLALALACVLPLAGPLSSLAVAETEDACYITEIVNIDTTNGAEVTPRSYVCLGLLYD